MDISELTRRNIFGALRASNVVWSGRLSETDFLLRLYDLDNLPSQDHRFESAADDIWQHCENNPGDWPIDWVYDDSRFDLLNAPDEVFLRFLCEMIHPIVRTDNKEVQNLLGIFNKNLAVDGWEIAARTQLSGMPVFAARHRIVKGNPALGTAIQLVKVPDAGYVTQQITRMEAAVESDPELAIGTAKELVETICKTILCECGEKVSNSANLPQLVKMVRERLELLPQDIPDRAKGVDTIRRLLSNLGTVAQNLAELRGLYGSGHGKQARVKGLQPRHARLAVNAASTLAVFLFETYQERHHRHLH
nr:abortive infection family protein [candidate division Zixibacteria bacterium]